MENVSSLELFRRKRQAEQEKSVSLDNYYPFNPSFMLMQPHQIIEDLKFMANHAASVDTDGYGLKHIRVHKLFELMRLIFNTVILPVDVKVKPFVSYDTAAECFTVTMVAVNIDHTGDKKPAGKADAAVFRVFVEEMVLEDHYMKNIDTGVVAPVEQLSFSYLHSELKPYLPRRIVKNINDLVEANGGCAGISDHGYTAVLHDGGYRAISISIVTDDLVIGMGDKV